MKLIPPQEVEEKKPVELGGTLLPVIRKPKAVEVDPKVQALTLLDQVVKTFTKDLSNAINRIGEQEEIVGALGLVALLEGTRGMLDAVGRVNISLEDVDGHKGSSARASASESGTRGTRKKAARTGNTDSGQSGKSVAALQTDGAPVKRGRGRPPGSKNKTTVERERAERAAKRIAKAGVAGRHKSVVKSPAKRTDSAAARKSRGLVAKPKKASAARKGSAGRGRKPAVKAKGKKR